MNESHDCPFCNLQPDEKIILETKNAYAVCDTRPAIIGHVLAIPKSHTPSIYDLDPLTRCHVRLVQQEISARIFSRFNEVGCYEHGRSMLCRFHDVNRGHFHAHVHILPFSFDLISASQYTTLYKNLPMLEHLKNKSRYLYQEIGYSPQETWATGELAVQRHFVRTELQNYMLKKGLDWIPLDASPEDHDDNIDETYSILKSSSFNSKHTNILVVCESLSLRQAIINHLRRLTGWNIVDLELAVRTIVYVIMLRKWNDINVAVDYIVGKGQEKVIQNFAVTDLSRSLANAFKIEIQKAELLNPRVTSTMDFILNDKKSFNQIRKIIKITCSKKKNIFFVSEKLNQLIKKPSLKISLKSSQESKDVLLNSKVRNNSMPGFDWTDFRIEIGELSAEEIATVVIEARNFRFIEK